MNFYEMISWEYDGDYSIMLCHKKKFSAERFSRMCAKAFVETYAIRSTLFEEEITNRAKEFGNKNNFYEDDKLKEDLKEYSQYHFEYGDLIGYASDFMSEVYGFKVINPISAFVVKSSKSPHEEAEVVDENFDSTHNLIKTIYESKRFILIEKKGNVI